MITLCWSAKGGTGTTTVSAAIALAHQHPTLLVDLAGDMALALGLPRDDAPTLADWFASDAPAERLARLHRRVTPTVDLLPTSTAIERTGAADRWRAFARALRDDADRRDVVVDAGLGPPPPALAGIADRSLLITKRCYLAVTHAVRLAARPTGIVVIDEPGRALDIADIESSIGAPVVATMLYDPKISRALDAGLALSRLPGACLHEVRMAS
jgi:MinD-like ATPase involved in chromosome partitioning or flagellar assembly